MSGVLKLLQIGPMVLAISPGDGGRRPTLPASFLAGLLISAGPFGTVNVYTPAKTVADCFK